MNRLKLMRQISWANYRASLVVLHQLLISYCSYICSLLSFQLNLTLFLCLWSHFIAGMRAYDMSRYRTSAEPPQPSSQLPSSSQADSYSQVPKTHRVMTLADHISVRNAQWLKFTFEYKYCFL